MPTTQKKKIKVGSDDEQIALEFSPNNLKQVFREIVKEGTPFEILGQGIIVLPRNIAERLKKQASFGCKEVEIVSLFRLPREEANRIRKRHLHTLPSLAKL